MKTLLLAIPGKTLPAPFAYRLQEAKNANLGFDIEWAMVGTGSIAIARDDLSAIVFNNKKYMGALFIDTDVKWEIGHIKQLIERREPFISGIYSWKRPGLQWHLSLFTSSGGEPVRPDENGLFHIDGTGGGFMYVAREVLEAMYEQQPERRHDSIGSNSPYNWWFQGVIKDENWPKGRFLGEDHGFCYWAKKAGYHLKADSRVVMLHTGDADYPLEMAYNLIPKS